MIYYNKIYRFLSINHKIGCLICGNSLSIYNDFCILWYKHNCFLCTIHKYFKLNCLSIFRIHQSCLQENNQNKGIHGFFHSQTCLLIILFYNECIFRNQIYNCSCIFQWLVENKFHIRYNRLNFDWSHKSYFHNKCNFLHKFYKNKGLCIEGKLYASYKETFLILNFFHIFRIFYHHLFDPTIFSYYIFCKSYF